MARRRLTVLSGALLCNYMQMALFNSPLISSHPPAPNSIWAPLSALGLACSTRAAVKHAARGWKPHAWKCMKGCTQKIMIIKKGG